jgi:hypothetical protein
MCNLVQVCIAFVDSYVEESFEDLLSFEDGIDIMYCFESLVQVVLSVFFGAAGVSLCLLVGGRCQSIL